MEKIMIHFSFLLSPSCIAYLNKNIHFIIARGRRNCKSFLQVPTYANVKYFSNSYRNIADRRILRQTPKNARRKGGAVFINQFLKRWVQYLTVKTAEPKPRCSRYYSVAVSLSAAHSVMIPASREKPYRKANCSEREYISLTASSSFQSNLTTRPH